MRRGISRGILRIYSRTGLWVGRLNDVTKEAEEWRIMRS